MSAWLEIVAGADYLMTADGDVFTDATSLARAVEIVRGLRRPSVLWIHESAHAAWSLPDEADDLGEHLTMPEDARSSPGWVRLDRDVHVALPVYSGDFEGCSSPTTLADALRLWSEHVGDTFLFSAPSTALHSIGKRFKGEHRPTRAAGIPFAPSAYAVPASAWTREPEPDEAAMPLVQLFDRRGSYLAAWRSCELPDGEWLDLGALTWSGAKWAPGYYLIDLAEIRRYVATLGLHDPFTRAPYVPAHGAAAPPVDAASAHLSTGTWLTEPLAVLAGELAGEAGVELPVLRALVAERRCRALDGVATRLSEARVALDARPDPAARVVVDLIKDAYTRGTAHFEFGRRPPHPLHRPEWRHTIIDRHVANTWRSLRRAASRPIVVGGVDSALFPVSAAEDAPAGLRMGPELGSWKRAGEPMPMADALARLGTDRSPRAARALIFGMMGGAA